MRSRLVKGKKGYIIRYVPVINTPDGRYQGMNRQAAHSKKINMKYPFGENVILVDKTMPKKQQERVIVHEAVEHGLMDDNKKNWGYLRSHEVANGLEDDPNILIRVRGDSQKRGTIRRRL